MLSAQTLRYSFQKEDVELYWQLKQKKIYRDFMTIFLIEVQFI